MNADLALPPVVLLVVGGAITYAFSAQAMGAKMLIVMLVAYVALTAVAVWRMLRDGTLLDLFRWRRGDIALGVGVALALGAAVYFGRQMVAPRGSPMDFLVMRLYTQIGEPPKDHTRLILVSLGVVLVAGLEEVVWRGLVQQVLEERFGVRVGWLGTAGLYALAHVPTIWLLAMPGAGKNPFLPLAALFCGVVWGFLVGRIQRLPPAIISHVFFTYGFAVQFPLWP